MDFEPALYDGTDHLYAPCISWSGKYSYWKAPAKYVKAGYAVKLVRLAPGTRDDEIQADRAKQCRTLTRDMLQWWNGQEESALGYGTWKYLIARYKSDQFSPYGDVKENTREVYNYLLARWENVIGHMEIGALDFVTVKKIEQAMKEKGYSISNVKRMFTMLRTLASYGKALHLPGARDVKETLSEMRFASPAARSVAPTRAQIMAIVEQADRAGAYSFSAGILLQYELILRPVDVRGQWLKVRGETSGIIRNGKRWQDGLTCDMFNDDLSGFEKVISKTQKSLPEPYFFDLAPLPSLRTRLVDLRPEKPLGPVIVTERHGLPWDRHAWSNAWRRFRKAAGIEDDIQLRDTRAGGITEAKQMGVDPYALRDAGQHASINTTNRYARGRSETANKVVKIRNQNGK